MVNTIYFALAIYTSKSKSLSFLAAHHILFEISFMMNFITMVVFWSVLFNQALIECNNHPGRINNVYYAHLVPGISVLINFIISDAVIRASHVKIILPISAVYGYVNYLEVKSLGRPLYWFLTWEDMTSVYIYLGLMVFFSFVYIGLAKLTKALKPR